MWELRRVGSVGPWLQVPVPGCWEDAGLPVTDPGPYLYRRTLTVPSETSGRRVWLRFEAVSYACRVLVDGTEVGGHRGAWDAFEFEVTAHARPGGSIVVEVEVEKPASLTAGPDSDAVPGRYPLRSTLSGFLPYVWGHMFGGIWQGVSLVATGDTVITDAHVATIAPRTIEVEARLSGTAPLDVTVTDADGRIVAQAQRPASEHHRWAVELPEARCWAPGSPALYRCRLRVADGDERTLAFGVRDIRARGATITLDGVPIYPRLILSWGWYPGSFAPTPSDGRIREDLEALRAMGFNGVKLCLWFPPDRYFAIADELGMLVWLELPMWLPVPDAGFADQVTMEAERLVRQARRHPSVILYTLGCELGMATAELTAPLYRRVKGLVGHALVRDNSGSGEAYGGLLDESADFHDHHPYADLPWLPGLLQYFGPAWRPPQPWLLGEFADSDVIRDPRALAGPDGRAPWWADRDVTTNPQGARWAMEPASIGAALDRSGLTSRMTELRQTSEQASLLHRKQTLEHVRSVADITGYVVTGERDTPISTAGIWDDTGRQRFPAEALRSFNDDLVVLVGWGRRRAWVAGGDRPAPFDPWTYRSGQGVRAHLIGANHGRARGPATVAWDVRWLDAQGATGEPVATGRVTDVDPLDAGTVRELAIARFDAPDVERPRACRLEATVTIGDIRATNAWPLWVFPRDPWPWEGGTIAVVDPHGRLDDLAPLVRERIVGMDDADVVIATAWPPEMATRVAGGGSAVLLQSDRAGPLPAEPLPFWREAVRIAEPHPAWHDFPVQPFVGLQLRASSADHAFDADAHQDARPLLRRLDARSGRVHDYAVEMPYGKGRIIATTLRLDGRTGDLPLGISRSPGALYLLGCWVRYLAGR